MPALRAYPTPGSCSGGNVSGLEPMWSVCRVLTAFVPALVASGLPCDRFVFEGFLPPKKGRATRLSLLSADSRTVVIYESPKRLQRTLRQLADSFGGERRACVCREISKLHETYHRVSTLGELSNYFEMNQAKGGDCYSH